MTEFLKSQRQWALLTNSTTEILTFSALYLVLWCVKRKKEEKRQKTRAWCMRSENVAFSDVVRKKKEKAK